MAETPPASGSGPICPFCAEAAPSGWSFCKGCGAKSGWLDENRDRDFMLTLALGPLMGLGFCLFAGLLIFRASRLGSFETILVGFAALVCLAALAILARCWIGRRDERVWRKGGEIRAPGFAEEREGSA